MLSGDDVRTLIRAGLRSVRAVTERWVFEIRQSTPQKSLKPNRELADKIMNEYENRVRILQQPYMRPYTQREAAGEPTDRLRSWWMDMARWVRMEALTEIAESYNLVFRREPL